jgi:hypothetical protein
LRQRARQLVQPHGQGPGEELGAAIRRRLQG